MIFLKRAGEAAVTTLLPPLCASCGALTTHPHAVCGPCWRGLTFISNPCCARCALPHAFAAPGMECACPPMLFDGGRAPLVYDGLCRKLLLSFKNSDGTEKSQLLAGWMLHASGDMLGRCDLLAPVPLHWTRMFMRRYNQAALLAQALGRRAGIAAAPCLLARRRRTRAQHASRRAERMRNLHQAFKVTRPETVEGQTVGVVDDIWTTGATFNEAARALKAAGAARVYVFSVARTLNGGIIPPA